MQYEPLRAVCQLPFVLYELYNYKKSVLSYFCAVLLLFSEPQKNASQLITNTLNVLFSLLGIIFLCCNETSLFTSYMFVFLMGISLFYSYLPIHIFLPLYLIIAAGICLSTDNFPVFLLTGRSNYWATSTVCF